MFTRIMPVHAAGGMQDHVQTLSAGLAARGHRVVVITTARGDGVESDNTQGIETHYLRGSVPGEYSRAWWSAAADKCAGLHRARAFDVLHSQSMGAFGVYQKNLHHRWGLPLITSLHGTHLDVLTTTWHTDFSLRHPLGMARFFALAADLAYRYLRDVPFFRASDAMIATSDADVSKYQRLYGIPAAKIRKVYNGIDTRLFSPRRDAQLRAVRAEFHLPAEEKIILALARLQKDKGVQNAIDVMPTILKKFTATLIVVGDGDYRAALEARAQARGVADRVRFVGARSLSECADYFNLCDVFVDPTLRTDGYDLTIAEAMACGKPTIASDVGANATLIDMTPPPDGILIPRGDNAALAREIERVLSDPGLARTMGHAAREKMAARFSVDAMVAGMERVYQEWAA